MGKEGRKEGRQKGRKGGRINRRKETKRNGCAETDWSPNHLYRKLPTGIII